MEHWPAMRLWSDLSYLERVAGNRTVPVEVRVQLREESLRGVLRRSGSLLCAGACSADSLCIQAVLARSFYTGRAALPHRDSAVAFSPTR
jgi:hypothetical protein